MISGSKNVRQALKLVYTKQLTQVSIVQHLAFENIEYNVLSVDTWSNSVVFEMSRNVVIKVTVREDIPLTNIPEKMDSNAFHQLYVQEKICMAIHNITIKGRTYVTDRLKGKAFNITLSDVYKTTVESMGIEEWIDFCKKNELKS